MGREIKRVALDFVWPLDKVWEGFINPHDDASIPCPHCEHGYSEVAKKLKDQWYGYGGFKPEDRGSKPHNIFTPAVRAFAERNVANSPSFYGSGEYAIEVEALRLSTMWNQQWAHHLNQDDVNALVEAGRLMDFTHTWDETQRKWIKKDPEYIPTAEEVNDWSMRGFGHDSINSWVVIEAECKRLGVPTYCEHCNGSGSLWTSEEARQRYENWEPTEPPSGEGWQVWETVSEGSPITPVFATREALIDYLVEGGDGWDRQRGERGWSRAAAEKFVKDEGSFPSGIIIGGQIYTAGDDLPEDESDDDNPSGTVH